METIVIREPEDVTDFIKENLCNVTLSDSQSFHQASVSAESNKIIEFSGKGEAKENLMAISEAITSYYLKKKAVAVDNVTPEEQKEFDECSIARESRFESIRDFDKVKKSKKLTKSIVGTTAFFVSVVGSVIQELSSTKNSFLDNAFDVTTIGNETGFSRTISSIVILAVFIGVGALVGDGITKITHGKKLKESKKNRDDLAEKWVKKQPRYNELNPKIREVKRQKLDNAYLEDMQVRAQRIKDAITL